MERKANLKKRDGNLSWFLTLPRSLKRLVMVIADAFTIAIALWSGFALRLSDWWPSKYLDGSGLLFLILPLLGIVLFHFLGLYRVVVRFMNFSLLFTIAFGSGILVFICFLLGMFLSTEPFPRSIPLIFGLVLWIYLVTTRLVFLGYHHWILSKNKNQKRVIIYGADPAGWELFDSLKHSGEFAVKAFVDDSKSLINTSLSGIRVYPPSAIGELIEDLRVELVLLALPKASKREKLEILRRLTDYPVQIRIIPSLSASVYGNSSDDFKEVSIDDLLGRAAITPLPDLMSTSITDKVVCITGAGGSIGSEIARHCIINDASLLVLIESSELALYKLERQLLTDKKQFNKRCDLKLILGSVTNQKLMKQLVEQYCVKTIYHAAAYKHVPLVEANPFSGVTNNVFGTSIMAQAAVEGGVERFVFISTDKAVRPTNVMGATKRMAELVIQNLADKKNQRTIFSIVRFGNVLGSSGSVVPLFREQIAGGGPVTVTHRDVTRFFMTIEEATSLVLQAGSLAKGGEVFLLDMGQPITISQLAKTMIHLSGRTVRSAENPDGDIEIQYSGLRSGEKLYEELLIGNNSKSTVHPKIFSALEAKLKNEEIKFMLGSLHKALKAGDLKALTKTLKLAVKGYDPKN